MERALTGLTCGLCAWTVSSTLRTAVQNSTYALGNERWATAGSDVIVVLRVATASRCRYMLASQTHTEVRPRQFAPRYTFLVEAMAWRRRRRACASSS